MKTITLTLTPEMAKQMLPALERQQRVTQDQLAKITEQIELIRKELREPDTIELFAPKVAPVAQTETGRAKKGETEKAVSEFLRNVNGQGAKIITIAKSTATNYGSVRRILMDMKESGNAKERDGLWFWKD